MAGRTQGDRIGELEKLGTTLGERLHFAREQLSVLLVARSEVAEALADLRRDFALLKQEFEQLKLWRDDQKKERDERSRRLWAFGPNIVGALISGIIAAIVALLISFHRP